MEEKPSRVLAYGKTPAPVWRRGTWKGVFLVLPFLPFLAACFVYVLEPLLAPGESFALGGMLLAAGLSLVLGMSFRRMEACVCAIVVGLLAGSLGDRIAYQGLEFRVLISPAISVLAAVIGYWMRTGWDRTRGDAE